MPRPVKFGTVRNYHKSNRDKLDDVLERKDWSVIKSCSDINIAVETMLKFLVEAEIQDIPTYRFQIDLNQLLGLLSLMFWHQGKR